MKSILDEKPTGLGAKYQLIQYDKNYFGYGTESELNSFLGASVNNYGTKNDMINRFNSLLDLLDEFIQEGIEKNYDFIVNMYSHEKAAVISFLNVLQNL